MTKISEFNKVKRRQKKRGKTFASLKWKSYKNVIASVSIVSFEAVNSTLAAAERNGNIVGKRQRFILRR